MIFLDSRYVDGPVFKAYDSRTNTYELTVFRQFPSYFSKFYIYEWKETDRIDALAKQVLGKVDLWWQIMDLNPEILNPFNIAPGTQLRIPND